MRVSVSVEKPLALKTDCLIAVVWEGDLRGKTVETPDLKRLDRETHGALENAVNRGQITGKAGESAIGTGRGGRAVIFLGGGKWEEMEAKGWMTLAAKAAEAAKGQRAKSAALLVRTDLEPDQVRLLTQGAHLGAYAYGGKKDPKKPALNALSIVLTSDTPELREACAAGSHVGEALTFARDLVNTPANLLTPTILAERAKVEGEKAGLEVEIIDEGTLADMGAGGILGVAQGSDEPPRLIILKHRPKRASKKPHLGLVGKGVTFDSGGISIKPSEKMDLMKMDMGGAAATIGAMIAIARLDIPVTVTAAVPSTENMINGSAVKPGDVMTMLSGKTVENLNTDAEGRLILADALTHICREVKPTHLMDFATLTGACVVALGQQLAGVMSDKDAMRHLACDLAESAGEGVWPLPLTDDFREQIKDSDVADLRNMGKGRWAGASTAAAFLEQFVECPNWIHVDIAGPAMGESPFGPYRVKGGTGAGLLLAVEMARSLAR